jgi:hypothetical protein
VLATDVVRQDRLGSRCPAVVDVKPTEHARDLDRLGQVDVQDGFRRHPLPNALVRSALVEVQLVLAEKRAKMAQTAVRITSRRRPRPRGRTPDRTCRRDPAAGRLERPPCWLLCASGREHGGSRRTRAAPPATQLVLQVGDASGGLWPWEPRQAMNATRHDRTRPGYQAGYRTRADCRWMPRGSPRMWRFGLGGHRTSRCGAQTSATSRPRPRPQVLVTHAALYSPRRTPAPPGIEQDRVDAIEHATMGQEDLARILHAGSALHHRLGQVADRSRNRSDRADDEPVADGASVENLRIGKESSESTSRALSLPLP